MARHCEQCGYQISETAAFCKHCGASVAATQGKSLHSAAGPPPQPPPIASGAARTGPPVFYKNPGVATLLSFLWAGAGQIYNGQIAKGIVFIAVYGLSVLLMFVLVGFITTPILWIIGMVDANSSAKRINERLAREQEYR
jgi:TM2 domain-containing membrane protein YozV